MIDCGDKHLRLAALIVVIVLSICAGTIAYANLQIRSLEARVRMIEQSEAANRARFEAIQQSINRIEATLNKIEQR